MGTNLKNYLTGEEMRQMDKLLEKAEERMREEGEGYNGQLIIMACHCECGQTGKYVEERDNLPNDMENLLRQVCDFCKKHDMCPDESLPFPC